MTVRLIPIGTPSAMAWAPRSLDVNWWLFGGVLHAPRRSQTREHARCQLWSVGAWLARGTNSNRPPSERSASIFFLPSSCAIAGIGFRRVLIAVSPPRFIAPHHWLGPMLQVGGSHSPEFLARVMPLLTDAFGPALLWRSWLAAFSRLVWSPERKKRSGCSFPSRIDALAKAFSAAHAHSFQCLPPPSRPGQPSSPNVPPFSNIFCPRSPSSWLCEPEARAVHAGARSLFSSSISFSPTAPLRPPRAHTPTLSPFPYPRRQNVRLRSRRDPYCRGLQSARQGRQAKSLR